MIDDTSETSEPPRGCVPGEVEPVIAVTADDVLPGPARHKHRARQSLSQRLSHVANGETRARIAVTDLMTPMLIFAAPDVVAGPPGLSAVLGLPLIYLTWQLISVRRPWLPAVIARRTIANGYFAALVLRIAPLLARLNRLLRPRLGVLVGYSAERMVGGFCLILSLVVALPIALGNILQDEAISLMIPGLLERDGLGVAIGMLTGPSSLVVVAAVIFAAIKAVFSAVARAGLTHRRPFMDLSPPNVD